MLGMCDIGLALMRAVGLCAVQCSAVLGFGALLSAGKGSHLGGVCFMVVG